MITLKLTRDEARTIDHYFFSYLDRLIFTFKPIGVKEKEEEILSNIFLKDIFTQIDKIIKRKLISSSAKFKIKLTNSQAVVLYRILMLLPLDPNDIYLINLRNSTINYLHKELLKISIIIN